MISRSRSSRSSRKTSTTRWKVVRPKRIWRFKLSWTSSLVRPATYHAALARSHLRTDFSDLFGATITIRENDEKKFLKTLESRIGSARKKRGPKKWALLTRLVIKCNSNVLSNGTILVDLPGSGYCSSNVLQTTTDFKSKLDVKLVAVRPARATNEAVVIGEAYLRHRIHRTRLT